MTNVKMKSRNHRPVHKVLDAGTEVQQELDRFEFTWGTTVTLSVVV